MFDWKDAEHNCSYFFKILTGRIVGQAYNLAHTNIWGAKIITDGNEEKYLGQYINQDFAKKAIEFYWKLKEQTFDSQENLLENKELLG
jgi:hypothetical protein